MKLFLIAIGLCLITSAYATHLTSGQIIVEQTSVGSRTVKITIRVYTSAQATILLGTGANLLDFGDGSTHRIPEINDQFVSGPLRYSTYSIFHTYDNYNAYLVSYTEPNRNADIRNFAQSIQTPFYLEAFFTLTAEKKYTSPTALIDPFFAASTNDRLSLSAAAMDPNDHTLFYDVVSPRMGRKESVKEYQLPAQFKVDQYNGLLTWDGVFKGQNVPGEYLFAIRIYQFEGNQMIGYAYRDFQIFLTDETTRGSVDDNKNLNEHNQINVDIGGSANVRVFAFHNPDESVEFVTASELESQSDYTVSIYDSLSSGQNIRVALITLSPGVERFRDNPYVFCIRSEFSNGGKRYSKDLNYLVLTKETELPAYPIVLSTPKRKEHIQAAPNPVKDVLHFVGLTDREAYVEVHALSGKLIARQRSERGALVVTDFAPGLYIVTVRDLYGDIVYRSKILKE